MSKYITAPFSLLWTGPYRIPLVLLLGTAVCTALRYVCDFGIGFRFQSHLLVMCDLAIALLGIILALGVIVCSFIAFFESRRIIWGLLIITCLLCCKWLEFGLFPPARAILYGLRCRIMHEYGAAILQRFATDFDQLPFLPDNRNPERKTYMREDLVETQLPGKYSFLKGNLGGPSFVSEAEGRVRVRWGAALTAHWGFDISVNGASLNPDPSLLTLLGQSSVLFVVGD